jgi:hypothetical protein
MCCKYEFTLSPFDGKGYAYCALVDDDILIDLNDQSYGSQSLEPIYIDGTLPYAQLFTFDNIVDIILEPNDY